MTLHKKLNYLILRSILRIFFWTMGRYIQLHGCFLASLYAGSSIIMRTSLSLFLQGHITSWISTTGNLGHWFVCPNQQVTINNLPTVLYLSPRFIYTDILSIWIYGRGFLFISPVIADCFASYFEVNIFSGRIVEAHSYNLLLLCKVYFCKTPHL